MRINTLWLAGVATVITAGLLPAAQAQQGVSLGSGLTDFTSWTLLGSATATNQTPGNGFTYSLLELTRQGTGAQAGAAFAPTALMLDFNQAFHFDFNFFMPVVTDLRGDGMSFTLSSASAVGNAGSGLGYEGLGVASVAFAIDTFHFDGEPVSPSLQILQAGSVTPLAATETGLGDSIRNADLQWFATIDYTPSGNDDQSGLLTGAISHLNLGDFSVSAVVDFSELAQAPGVFYGFTASTGAALDGHYVTSAAALPVPEPGSWALLIAGLAAVGSVARRRRQRADA